MMMIKSITGKAIKTVKVGYTKCYWLPIILRSFRIRMRSSSSCSNESFEKDTTHGFIQIDASNAFNSVNRILLLHNVKILCPKIATYIDNCHMTPFTLFITGEKEISSNEGTTQRDPIATGMNNNPGKLINRSESNTLINWTVGKCFVLWSLPWSLSKRNHAQQRKYIETSK